MWNALCFEGMIAGDCYFIYGKNIHWRCAMSKFCEILGENRHIMGLWKWLKLIIMKIWRSYTHTLWNALCYEGIYEGNWNFIYASNIHWSCAMSRLGEIYARIHKKIGLGKMDKIVKIRRCDLVLCGIFFFCYERMIV